MASAIQDLEEMLMELGLEVGSLLCTKDFELIKMVLEA